MRVTIDDTTTQIVVKAFTTLDIVDFQWDVGKKTARIDEAQVYWIYSGGGWAINFIVLEGPVIRKKDGAESSQRVSVTTVPFGESLGGASTFTPGEIADAARANVPHWTPVINEPPYARTPDAPSSL